MYGDETYSMHVALEVELPGDYWSLIHNFPFLDHEGTSGFALWDRGEDCIQATLAGRKSFGWPLKWVQIGADGEALYLLDTDNGSVIKTHGTSYDAPLERWPSATRFLDSLLDGYQGRLPPGWARRDSSFQRIRLESDIPWAPPRDSEPRDPLSDDAVVRLNEESAAPLRLILEERGIEVIEVDGRTMRDRESMFDAFSTAIVGGPGSIDDWIDISHRLGERLAEDGQGRVREAILLWRHCDVASLSVPHRMLDAIATLESLNDLDFFTESSTWVRIIYCGQAEHHYTLRVAPQSPDSDEPVFVDRHD